MAAWLIKYKLSYLLAPCLIFILIRLSFVNNSNRSVVTQNLVSLNYVLCIAVAYFISYRFVIDHYQHNRRAAFLSFVMLIITAGALLLFINYFLLSDGTRQFQKQYFRVFNVVSSSFFIVFLSGVAAVAFRLIQDQNRTRLKLETAQKEKARTELDLLKAQINPHFMFNSINTVFVQIDVDPGRAKKTLLSFSELLRYQLYECNTETVSVEKEIAYLENYLELERSRKDKRYDIRFTYRLEVKKFRVAPLLFMPLVENAFKYLSHYKDKLNYVLMDLRMGEEWLVFSLKNSKEAVVKEQAEYSGIGLSNVKMRLDLLYRGGHRLDIQETGDSFEVNLKIKVL